MIHLKRNVTVFGAFVWLSVGGPLAVAQHAVISPDQIEWKPAVGALPLGAQIAVLDGDPAQPGLFTLRLKFPANYQIAPHWHSTNEHATVLSGTINIGVGEKFDKSKAHAVSAGSLMVMPAKTNHFAWNDGEVVLQLHGMGPWQVNYVDPADDPRQR
jgi:mannose-6-phosphate isomerase-like protein (cupin superfamily)